jgi:hypothetical protein
MAENPSGHRNILCALRVASVCLAFLPAIGLADPDRTEAPAPRPASQQAVAKSPPLNFRLFSGGAGHIQLVNGTVVQFQPQDKPAVLIASFAPNPHSKDGFCTATIVGYKVVLLAAHCLDTGNNTDLRAATITLDMVPVALACQVDPAYLATPLDQNSQMPRRSEDFALCHIDTPLDLPTLRQLAFEVLDLSPLGPHEDVLMVGYGCTDLKTKFQDHVLRVGDAQVTTPASGPAGAAYLKINTGIGHPALCPGDSGGPLFTGISTHDLSSPRRDRAVNSWSQDLPTGYVSGLAPLSDASFAVWAKQWLACYPGDYICGLTMKGGMGQCRI